MNLKGRIERLEEKLMTDNEVIVYVTNYAMKEKSEAEIQQEIQAQREAGNKFILVSVPYGYKGQSN